MQVPKISIMPCEIFSDNRLSFRELRVFGVLCGHADRRTKACFLKRGTIAKEARISETFVSVATKKLAEYGWIMRVGNGGRSRVNTYTISDGIPPKTVTNSETVTKSETVTDLVTKTVTNLVTKTVTDLVTPNITPPLTPPLTPPVTDAVKTAPGPIADESKNSSFSKTKSVSRKKAAIGAATWQAYSTAYLDRYGTEPVRNKTVNSHIAKFVERIGAQEAPYVAAYYVQNNNQFYITKAHSTAILLMDAEKLRMEWATRRQVTSAQARQADKSQSNFSAVEEAKRIYARREPDV